MSKSSYSMNRLFDRDARKSLQTAAVIAYDNGDKEIKPQHLEQAIEFLCERKQMILSRDCKVKVGNTLKAIIQDALMFAKDASSSVATLSHLKRALQGIRGHKDHVSTFDK